MLDLGIGLTSILNFGLDPAHVKSENWSAPNTTCMFNVCIYEEESWFVVLSLSVAIAAFKSTVKFGRCEHQVYTNVLYTCMHLSVYACVYAGKLVEIYVETLRELCQVTSPPSKNKHTMFLY